MIGFGDFYPKCPLILAIVVFMSLLNFMPGRVEDEKSLITPGAELLVKVNSEAIHLFV